MDEYGAAIERFSELLEIEELSQREPKAFDPVLRRKIDRWVRR